MATSANRITGLATGLDIDSIVKSSMMTYQNKIDKVYKQKSIAEIKQQLYRDVVTEGQEFYNNYFDITKSGNLVSQSSFSSTSFMSSNEAVATAIGSSTALKSNYTINVTKKAEAARIKLAASSDGSTMVNYDGSKYTLNSSIRISSGSADSYGVVIDAETFNKQNFTSLSDAAKYINTQISASGYKAYTSDFSGGNIILETKSTGKEQKIQVESGITKLSVKDSSGSTTGLPTSLSIADLLSKDSDNKYSSYQDIMVTYDGNTTVIKADTLRNIASSYKSSKDTISKFSDNIANETAGDGKVTLTTKDKDGLSTINSYLQSYRAELVSKGQEANADEIKKIDDNIKSVSGILNRFTSETESVILTDDEKNLLLGGAVNSTDGLIKDATAYNDNKINSSITDALNSTLKEVFGTTGDANNVTASIVGGAITLANANYVIGEAYYPTSSGNITLSDEGNGLEATVTNISTGESIEYTDLATSSDTAKKVGNNNSIMIDGTAITINSTGTTNLTAKTDVTKMKDNIVKFVNDYNTYVTKLNTLLTEKKYRDYEPLTDDQKDEMKDTEITAWEKKVKSGQLRGDSDLRKIRDDLVNSMTSMVSGAGITLSDMGINLVQSYGTIKDGTFTIDEDKLTSALENNTEEVASLFTQKGDTTATSGIAQRMKSSLYDQVVSTTKSNIINKAGMEGTVTATTSTLAKQITEYERKLEELQDWYDDKEQALYTKWANIETLMNNYNSQASYLSSMFSSGS